MREKAYSLLKRWCDKLLTYEFHSPDENVDGGLVCPACHVIHGRMSDLVYPFATLYKKSHDLKYLLAADRCINFCENNLLRSDGSYRNDAGSTWKGITVFSAIAIGDTLIDCRSCLPKPFIEKLESILRRQADFIYTYFEGKPSANINYYAGGAAALALAHRITYNGRYAKKAEELSNYCLKHFDHLGLFYGEIHGHDTVSPKGCHGIDMGYNIEESLPLLLKYAVMMQDDDMIDVYEKLLLCQMEFLLPDGGVDNSFGTRHNKWTYWGSRTSDGVISGFALALNVSIFATACKKVLDLWEKYTYNDLLSLPMAADAGEPTCLHHTMCHAKSLAALVNAELADDCKTTAELPADIFVGVKSYQNGNLLRVQLGGWRATFSAIDLACYKGSENSGGSMTLLWRRKIGPICAATMREYNQSEPLNMQYLRRSEMSPCMTPHLMVGGRNTVADMDVNLSYDKNVVTATGRDWKVMYEFYENEIKIKAESEAAAFILPIICDKHTEVFFTDKVKMGNIVVYADKPLSVDTQRRAFNQVGGFEYVPIIADFRERITITIELRD